MANSDHEQFGHGLHRGLSGSLSADQQRRVELLKLTKELQRKERERAAWRAASEPRSIFHGGIRHFHSPDHQSPPPIKPNKGESTFFAKLRLGRFLE